MSGSGGESRTVWRRGSKHSFQAAEGLEQTLTVEGDEPASILELVAVPRASTS
jgi:hypothetical protein